MLCVISGRGFHNSAVDCSGLPKVRDYIIPLLSRQPQVIKDHDAAVAQSGYCVLTQRCSSLSCVVALSSESVVFDS